ncbi:MAG: nickel pincer cofactor biosynthesis protein LarC [Chloroflexi bacterium]|nr:nickel pincer cofactor biosynthesis protein LarC [Chloroflexota bacterium]MCH8349515.1 nickel pincer cofactor biosynthesis protein LarC [Chloroflexota bacterium]MCI0781072.1 nickel pincer cofactor biosynthesis protein LarC [Chloroflexota bacterium]MCI0784947.1 nickel pincer cofactor biosynthesis protein LarC [Chloroflexota bacterium]MCI0791959.1 nickel pincer cofactor biosynthesis protein LarC [Chloroflexota bacterium]
MRIAYIQSIGGASGDMLLGALLDLGFPMDALQEELAKLDLSGFQLTAAQETRKEMRGTKLTVKVEDPTRYSPRWLLDTVKQSRLDEPVKEKAAGVLTALWRAESRVHGESEEDLELEELGSVDTLVDVVGVVAGLAHLGVEQVHASPLVLGAAEPPRWPGGYPNPAPATLELVGMAGAPVAADHAMYQGVGELTTPTGAALITTLADFQRPAMSVDSIGVGLGAKDPENFPNVIRVWLGETIERPAAGKQGDIVLLETNLDDVSGEVLGYAQEQLFALGALDVWYTPIQMKKNRPGVILSALVPASLEAAASELILRETPTLGVRTRPVERYAAERHSVPMETELGVISVKVKYLGGEPVSAAPEFEDCRRVALEAGLPLQEVYQRAVAEARSRFLT